MTTAGASRRARPRQGAPGERGHGLAGIRARVEALGGELVVESAPGSGTALAVALPTTRPLAPGRARPGGPQPRAAADVVIRIVLVDDHPVVRAGLRALLEGQPDLTVVGEAADAASARQVVRATEPDVVLMDLNLGTGQGGAEATEALRALDRAPQVLVLTTYDTETDIRTAVDAGAVGYLLKDVPPDQLFAGVRAAARGETVLAPLVAARLFGRRGAAGPALTPREVEILTLLARGLANKDIARQVLVSEATVKSHLSHVYDKLGVDTRAGAVARAIEQRIIRPPS